MCVRSHINKTTTYEDPRKGLEDEEPTPQPREVELKRDPEVGFGFVAGSEKPVVVRFVTEGRSPGDCRVHRSCKHSVVLTVCQPSANNSSPLDPNVPFMPNVLKVFLENGQTRSFKYDSTTTVQVASCRPQVPACGNGSVTQDVLHSLTEKLSIQCPEYFSLEVENYGRAAAQNKRRRFCLLDPQDLLAKVDLLAFPCLPLFAPACPLQQVSCWQIAARPGAHHLKCHYRLAFPPKDAYDLLKKDASAFDYFYIQCCNDVVNQRFSQEIKLEILLRLAALHIQQHSLDAGQSKVSIKAIEKECGLERFLPGQLLLTMKKKELRKLLAHFLKQNLSLCPPGQKQLTTFQAKLHYLKIVRELPGFGAKYFSLVSKDPEVELTLLAGQKYGLTQISSTRGNSHLQQQPQQLCSLEEIASLQVSREDEYHYNVEVQLLEREVSLLISLYTRTDENVQKITDLIKENPRTTLLELEQDTGISNTTIGRIVTEDLRLKKTPAKFIPRFLTNEQKLCRLATCEDMLEMTRTDPEWKDKIITGDETWVYGYNPETKRQSAEWRGQDIAPNDFFLFLKLKAVLKGRHFDTREDIIEKSLLALKSIPKEAYKNCFDNWEKRWRCMEYRVIAFLKRCVTTKCRYVRRCVVVPSYTSQHMVRELPWNYPTEGSTGGLRSVDLAVPPPPYMPCQVGRLHVYSVCRGCNTVHVQAKYSQNGSIDSGNPPTPVDHNMNETHHPLRRPDFPSLESGIDFQSVVSAEILEEDPLDLEMFETKNEAVLSRITEMNKIVTESESYLSDDRLEDEEVPCEDLEPGGPLRATDSLLLLTQVDEQPKPQSDEASIITLDVSPSESDAESTPTDSPLHRGTPARNSAELPQQRANRRDSSFGLLSPDMVPGLETGANSDLMDLLRKLKDAAEVDLPYTDANLYLDPDIIDLTLLPPPSTPDMPLSPFTKEPPPYAFFDPHCSSEEPSYPSDPDSARVVADLDNLVDVLSVLKGANGTDNLPHTPPLLPEDATEEALIEALTQDAVDIDQFIASVRVPPPPAVTDDIAAFIIPPPPSSSPIREVQDEVMARFRQASADIQRIMSSDESSVPKFCTDEEYEMWSQEHVANGVEPPSDDTSGYDTPSVISYGDGHVQDEAINRHLRINNSWYSVDNTTLPPSQKSSLSPQEVPLSRVCRSLSWTNMMDSRKPPLPPSSPQRSRRSSSATTGRPSSGKRPPTKNGNCSPESKPNLTRRNSFPRLLNGSMSLFSSDKEDTTQCNGHGMDGSYHNGDTTYEEKTFSLAQNEIAALNSHFSTLDHLRHSLDVEREIDKFVAARDSLIVEARQFVTSSKLFVKSAMESSDKMLENLRMCMLLLDRMASVSELAVVHMPSSEGISGLVERLRAVTSAFSHTVEAARCTLGKGIINPHMGDLMHRATTLATALTALMRTLRGLHAI
ncbi:FRMPD3 [Cordylochernes scorpioides]|uniref:FRMPD3 n=1 Tax=Cordylochernes scorpioides TaxID=51811 RepID=A0ABY6K0S6_9ARAC|nr:FRMPD3 [Cordylochernes scorpioides]